MPARTIDGKAVAKMIIERTARRRADLGFTPGLAAILVGDDPASHLYVDLKEKACARSGIGFEKSVFPADAAETEILAKIAELNGRPDIDAILVQLPLPAGLDEDRIIGAMDPTKDVDGFHPENLAALLQGRPRLVPGLAAGIMELIGSTGVPLAGKKALVVANNPAFYRPLAKVLSDAGAVPEFSGPDEAGLAESSVRADLLIVAVGRPGIITGDLIKPGAVIIDVGTNRLDGKLIGDVDAVSVRETAGWLTPVPGGVGPVTVAMLLANTVALAAAGRKTKNG